MRSVLIAAVVGACASAPSPGAAPPAPAPHAASAPAAPLTPLAAVEASLDLDGAVVGAARMPTVVMLLASWCHRCRDEIAVFNAIRAQHPHVRWLGLNYKAHEEYDGRGNSIAIRALADETPWLRIVPTDDALFETVGSPPKVPTIFVL